jgi:hypothetical protein
LLITGGDHRAAAKAAFGFHLFRAHHITASPSTSAPV